MSWKPVKGATARPADTYRGARRKIERGARHSLLLKAERKKTGESRRDMDRRREQARREREAA